METLGYGRHFIVDGFGAQADRLSDRERLRQFLVQARSLAEADHGEGLLVTASSADGDSAALLGTESQVVVHAFPELGSVTVGLFSRRDVLLSDLTKALADSFRVGRFESHLGNASKVLPREAERVERILVGDRSYARARLDPSPTGTDPIS